MKKIYLFLFLTIIVLSFSKTLKVGIYEYPPIIIKEDNKVKGVLPEILNYISEKKIFNWNIYIQSFLIVLNY
jgi:hypothetical protein